MSSFFSSLMCWKSKPNVSVYLYLGCCVLLLTLTLGFYRMFHTVTVTVACGTDTCEVASKAERVGDLLAEQGIVTGPNDRICPGPETLLEENLRISIQKAVPLVMTTATGSFRHYTQAKTVFGALQELGIPLTGSLVVEPALDAALCPGQEICLYRRVEVVETCEEIIPYVVEKKDDNKLMRGRQQVLQEGQEGKKELQYRVVYAGGRELLRRLIAEVVLQAPVSMIMAVGTKIAPSPAPPQLLSRGSRVEGKASWYGSEFQGRRTSSGEIYDQNGYTAAHRSLPFGTYVQVTSLRTGKNVTVRINDRGPHTGGRVIDLSRAAAEAIGLRAQGVGQVRLEILEEP